MDILVEVAERAVELGWEHPDDVDHVLYYAHAVRVFKTLADVGPVAAGNARALWYAYAKEAQDLDGQGLLAGVGGLDWNGGQILAVALYAPARVAVEMALLTAGKRRTGRARKLVNACRRLQMAGERARLTPVGRDARVRAAYVGGDGRARGLYVLARGEELEGEKCWDLLWQAASGAGSSARPSTRKGASREAIGGNGLGGDGLGLDLWDLEGGEF